MSRWRWERGRRFADKSWRQEPRKWFGLPLRLGATCRDIGWIPIPRKLPRTTESISATTMCGTISRERLIRTRKGGSSAGWGTAPAADSWRHNFGPADYWPDVAVFRDRDAIARERSARS